MKLTLLVILLKIAELAAVVLLGGFLPYWIGRGTRNLFERAGATRSRGISHYELGWMVMTCMFFLAFVVCGVLYFAIPANIAWAKRILGH